MVSNISEFIQYNYNQDVHLAYLKNSVKDFDYPTYVNKKHDPI